MSYSDLKTVVLLSRMDVDQMPGTVTRDFWRLNLSLYKGCNTESRANIKNLILLY